MLSVEEVSRRFMLRGLHIGGDSKTPKTAEECIYLFTQSLATLILSMYIGDRDGVREGYIGCAVEMSEMDFWNEWYDEENALDTEWPYPDFNSQFWEDRAFEAFEDDWDWREHGSSMIQAATDFLEEYRYLLRKYM